MDEGKVVMSFRVDRELREAIHRYAKSEHRTAANWVEAVLLRELQQRSGHVVTLESVDHKIELMLEEFRGIKKDVTVVKKKATKQEKKANNEDDELQKVLDLELPDTLSYEMWKDWVIYLREKRKNKLTVKLATEILERWKEADENGWDLDELVQLAIQRKWSDAVWEKHINEERKEEKPFWADAK